MKFRGGREAHPGSDPLTVGRARQIRDRRRPPARAAFEEDGDRSDGKRRRRRRKGDALQFWGGA